MSDSRAERIIKKEIVNPEKVSIERIPGRRYKYNVFENGENIAVGAQKITIVLDACEPCKVDIFYGGEEE